MHKWELTDDSCYQYRKELSNRKFELIQFVDIDELSEKFLVYKSTIDLDDFSDEELEKYIKLYYDGLKEVKEFYGDWADSIIAECIFEQQSTDEADFYHFYDEEVKAIEFIKEYVAEQNNLEREVI